MSDELERGLFSAVIAVAAGLELTATLRRIVQSAASLVSAEYGALGILGSDGKVAEFVYVGVDSDAADRIGPLPSGQGILGLLIDHPVPIRMEDLAQHPRSFGMPANHPPMSSFLGVPVRVRGEVFGNLYLTEKQGGGSFTAEDERTVTALAAAAGVAIENARLYDRATQRERWQRAVAEVVNAVLAGMDTEDVLAMAAARALTLTNASAALVALSDAEGGRPVVEIVDFSTSRVDAARDRWSVQRSRSIAGDAMTREDVDALIGAPLPEIVSTSATTGATAIGSLRAGPALALPLSGEQREVGVLVLLRDLGDAPFSDEDMDLAASFATQVAVSLVVAAVRREGERLAVYEERDRIARDLHDLVIQRLFATGMMLQGTARIPEVPTAASDRVARAIDELDATIKEIRHTIFALHEPVDGSPSGVRGRLMAEVSQAQEALGFKPAIRFVGPVDSLVPAEMEQDLTAVLREALTNAAKHANASRVDVLCTATSREIQLAVSDNGKGVGGAGRTSGVANMRNRALRHGGDCTLEAIPSGGTRLVWKVPTQGPSQ